MTCGIYWIRNLRSHHVYIGSSRNVERRLVQHRKELETGVHGNERLLLSWQRSGSESFELKLLEEVDVKGLRKAEQRWITKLNTLHYEYGYNEIRSVKNPTPKKLTQRAPLKYYRKKVWPKRKLSWSRTPNRGMS